MGSVRRSFALSPTGRSGARRAGRGDHGHAAGGFMHIRVPETKADMQKFKQLTSAYPPPEVHVRDPHTIIVWKQDGKTVAKKVVHKGSGLLGMWIESSVFGPDQTSGALGESP